MSSYSLGDDFSGEVVQRMKAEGLASAIVVEASPGNFQTGLNHGEVLDNELQPNGLYPFVTVAEHRPGT